MAIPMPYFVLGLLIVTLIVVACAGAYNKTKRNQSLAMGMLKNIMTVELKELYKTIARGNNLHAPMEHLCQHIAFYMALFDDNDLAIGKLNIHIASVRERMLSTQTGVNFPEIYVEMHPRLAHTMRINVIDVGRWMQDLHNFTNFDILERHPGYTA